jgi:hypothetical protein
MRSVLLTILVLAAAKNAASADLNDIGKLKATVDVCELFDDRGFEITAFIARSSGDALTDAWMLESAKGSRRGGADFHGGWYALRMSFKVPQPKGDPMPVCSDMPQAH